jgi:hypothetical protein
MFIDQNILAILLKWPTFLLRRLPNTSAGPPVVLSNILFDGIEWAQRCSTVRHPMLSIGPSMLHERSCRSLGMSHIVRSQYNVPGIETAHIPIEKAAKYLSWDIYPTFEDAVDCLE